MSSRKKASKPDVVIVGRVRARPIRGPGPDGRWYWRAELNQDGRTSTVWTGWAGVERVADILIDRIAREGIDKPAPRVHAVDVVSTVRDLMETYIAQERARVDISEKTKRINEFAARHVISVIPDVRLRDLNLSVLERYRDHRLRFEDAAPQTVQTELQFLRRAWRWGRDHRYCPDRELPKPKLKVHPRRSKFTPTIEEVARVIEHLSGWPKFAVTFLAATGARIDELATLRWADVDLDRRELCLKGKSRPRQFPMSDALTEFMKVQRASTPNADRVLPVTRATARASLSQRYIPAACQAAKVPRFTPHALRRRAVDELCAAGTRPETEAALLGHSVVVALRYYRKTTGHEHRTAVESAGLGQRVVAAALGRPHTAPAQPDET